MKIYYTLIFAIPVILSFETIIYFLIRGKKSSTLYSFLWCQANVLVWSLGKLFEVYAESKNEFNLIVMFEYLAISYIGISWLLFSIRYSNTKINTTLLAGLFIIPTIVYGLVLTNNFHHLYYTDLDITTITYGPLFWLHIVTTYIYMFWGTTILLKYAVSKNDYTRKQVILLAIAAIIPFSLNLIFIFKLLFNIESNIDLTPMSFSISLLFFVIATFKYKFLDIIPLAYKKIVDSLDDSVVVVDLFNKINTYNTSFKKEFSKIVDIASISHIDTLANKINIIPSTNNNLDDIVLAFKTPTVTTFDCELNIPLSNLKSFMPRIRPILSKKNELIGRIFHFIDITEYKNLIGEINHKNRELLSANHKLEEHVLTVEELTLTKERNRFAKDVHDTLGHTMSLLISLLEVSTIMCKKDSVQAEKKISQALHISRDGLRELRCSIKGLTPEKLSTNSLKGALNRLVSDFKMSEVNIDFSITGVEKEVNENISKAIFRTCQEGLTNSLRHGKAKNVTIVLKFLDEKIKIFIFDDGIGCIDINKGFGLTGMLERFESLNGKIIFGSDGEKGFNIRGEIPIDNKGGNIND